MNEEPNSMLHGRMVKKQHIFIFWRDAGTYASDNADLPKITAQSVEDWESRLTALVDTIDEVFWPSFNGASYRLV